MIAALLLACAPATDTASNQALTVLHANVGNLDDVFEGPCTGGPYRGAPCLLSEEQRIAESITALQPDLVFLMEVFDSDYCRAQDLGGDPDLVCSAPQREPYQQARRLLGPDYTVACDAIAHFDCVAARSELAMDRCPAGELCLGGADTPEHPPECAGIGGITSVSRVQVQLPDGALTLVAAHPLNAVSMDEDACRAAQYRQVFELAQGRSLVAGDFNFDPYRVQEQFETPGVWEQHVGPSQRFTAHSVDQDPPLPTWLDLATLDYLLSDFAEGGCEVLGVSPDTQLLDGGHMDHRALWCQLSW